MEVLTHGVQVQGRSEAVMGMVVGRGQSGDHPVWRAFCISLNCLRKGVAASREVGRVCNQAACVGFLVPVSEAWTLNGK